MRDANGRSVGIGELRCGVRRNLFSYAGRLRLLLIGCCGSVAVTLVKDFSVRRGGHRCLSLRWGCRALRGELRRNDERACEKHCGRHTAMKQIHDPKPLRGFCCLDSVATGTAPWRRWRIASYITTAPATDTFNELTFPAMGMRSRKSQVRLIRS